MTAYSSTSISLLNHCPAALDHADAETPRDNRHVFERGVACHAALEAIGKLATSEGQPLLPDEVEKAARAACAALIADGYTFAGRQQPTLSVEAVLEGRDLALAYQADRPISPGGRFEVGLAVDKDWRPVPYSSPDAYWRAIIDRLHENVWVGDEDYGAAGVEIVDYKTAWRADADELRTVQRRGQILVVVANLPNYPVYRATVEAVRSRKSYSTGGDFGHPRDVWPEEPEDRARLDRWRRDIDMLIDIAERQKGKRPFRPGRGCLNCPYFSHCDHGRERWKGWHPENALPVLAEEWLSATAAAKNIREQIGPACDVEPIPLPDGGSLGWRPSPSKLPAKDAARQLVELWLDAKTAPTPDAVAGLLKIIKPTPAQIELVVKQVTEDPAERSKLLGKLTLPIQSRRFGFIPGEEKEGSA